MDKFLTLVVSGAVTGAIYSLVASGLTLSYTRHRDLQLRLRRRGLLRRLSLLHLQHGACTGRSCPAAVVTILVFAPLLGLPAQRGRCSDLWPGRPSRPRSWPPSACCSPCRRSPSGSSTASSTSSARRHPRQPDVLQVGFPAGSRARARRSPGTCQATSRSTPTSWWCSSAPPSCARSASWFLMRRTPLGLQMRAVVDRPNLARIRGRQRRPDVPGRLDHRDHAGRPGRRGRGPDPRVAIDHRRLHRR